MNKKITAILLAMIMMVCNSMIAWAEDRVSATFNPDGSDNVNVTGTYVLPTGSGVLDLDGDNVPDIDEAKIPELNPDGTINGTITDGTDDKPDIIVDGDGDGTIESPIGAVYCVDITWGDMTYTYNASGRVWDGEKYVTQREGIWQLNKNSTEHPGAESNLIKVKNKSNVDITTAVTYSAETGYTGITGDIHTVSDISRAVDSGDDCTKVSYTRVRGSKDGGNIIPVSETLTNTFALPNAVINGNNCEESVYLHLSKPTKSWTKSEATIGKVTVTLGYAIINDEVKVENLDQGQG